MDIVFRSGAERSVRILPETASDGMLINFVPFDIEELGRLFEGRMQDPVRSVMLIGPADERWDHCFIAEYPSVAAFAEMIRDPVYREAVKHRQAAVEDSRLIRHAVVPVGKTFGEIPQ